MKTLLITLLILTLSAPAFAGKNQTVIELGDKGINVYDITTDPQGNRTVYDYERNKFWLESGNDRKQAHQDRNSFPPGVGVYSDDGDDD